MKMLEYSDDLIAQELFVLAGAALKDPGDAEPRRAFWKHVDKHSDHPWIGALTRLATASHPRGLAAGRERLQAAHEDVHPQGGGDVGHRRLSGRGDRTRCG